MFGGMGRERVFEKLEGWFPGGSEGVGSVSCTVSRVDGGLISSSSVLVQVVCSS